jgi:hypothetical protein
MHDDEKDKKEKPNNILRQTFSNKSSFRPLTEKSLGDNYGVHNHSSYDINANYNVQTTTHKDLADFKMQETSTGPKK